MLGRLSSFFAVLSDGKEASGPNFPVMLRGLGLGRLPSGQCTQRRPISAKIPNNLSRMTVWCSKRYVRGTQDKAVRKTHTERIAELVTNPATECLLDSGSEEGSFFGLSSDGSFEFLSPAFDDLCKDAPQIITPWTPERLRKACVRASALAPE